MGAERVLRHAPKFSGVASPAAHTARRGRGRESEQGGDDDGEVSAGDDVWDVESRLGTVQGLRKRRATSFQARPPSVQSVRASAADKAASARDIPVGSKASGDIATAQRDRDLTALMSSPALRDQQRFK